MPRQLLQGCLAHYSGGEFFRASAMPLYVVQVSGQPDHLFHDHDFTELVVVTQGRGSHATRRDEHPIRAGDAFVIHPDEQHSYKDTEGLGLYNAFFDLKRMGLPLRDLESSPGYRALFTLEPRLRASHGFRSRLTLSPAQLTVVFTLLKETERELAQRRAGYQSVAAALFVQVMAYLSRCYSHIEEPRPRALVRLGAVLEHLESRTDQPVRLEELARMAGMSRSSFQRAFRRALNASPVDYWIRLRVEKARGLLARGTVRVKEAAQAAGFDDSNYFTRQFRRVVGVSPREYVRSLSRAPQEPAPRDRRAPARRARRG